MALLCKCGFYVNENSGGMCSQCYKKHIKEAYYNDLLNSFKNLKIGSNDVSKEIKGAIGNYLLNSFKNLKIGSNDVSKK